MIPRPHAPVLGMSETPPPSVEEPSAEPCPDGAPFADTVSAAFATKPEDPPVATTDCFPREAPAGTVTVIWKVPEASAFTVVSPIGADPRVNVTFSPGVKP